MKNIPKKINILKIIKANKRKSDNFLAEQIFKYFTEDIEKPKVGQLSFYSLIKPENLEYFIEISKQHFIRVDGVYKQWTRKDTANKFGCSIYYVGLASNEPEKIRELFKSISKYLGVKDDK